MSFSSLQPQRYIVEIEILTLLLKRYISSRDSAKSEEDRLLVESDALVLLEKLFALDFELQEVQVMDYPDSEEVYKVAGDYEMLFTIALTKLRKLTELFLQHYNSNQAQLLGIVGKLKRAKQKKSVLKLWNSSEAKYVVAESFTNLDSVSNDKISKSACTINSGEGILTLPVKLQRNLSVKKVSVSAGSNGVPGNSDIEVTTNNQSIENVLKNDPNSWFEYERLDAGPLTLNICLELAKVDIINALYLVPINLGTSLSCRVDDILFSLDGVNTVSVKSLVSPNLETNSWEVRALTTNGWSLTFVPVKAKTIVVKLVQDQSYRIPVATGVSSRDRNRYAIGLRAITPKRLTFSREGGLNSVGSELPAGLYSGLPFADVFPPKPDLFDIQIDISLDHGDTWQSLDTLDTGVAAAFLLEGEETTLVWRIGMLRNDDAIRQVTSFLPDTTIQRETKSLLRTANAMHSPFTLSLPEKPHQGKVFAMQSKVTRRGSRHKRIYVGQGSGTTTSIGVPLDIASSGIDPDEVHVFVNGTEYTNTLDNLAIAAGEWAFSDDFTEFQFSADLPANARVELVLDSEIMDFELKADGYYHRMELLFDPDKESIDLESLPRNTAKASVTLPRDKTLINLGYKNILDDTFQLTSKMGATYTEVATRALVVSTLNSYYVDYPNGLLWLHVATNSDVVRVSFNHATGIQSVKDDYSVVYSEDGITPWGIKVNLDRFVCITYTDAIGAAVGKTIDHRTGKFAPRGYSLSSETTAKTLTYNRIVKGTIIVSDDLLGTTQKPEEITYLDGISEFYGLVAIKDEKTTTLAGTTDVVEFKLSAGALWYADLGVHFSNATYFSMLKTSAGAVNSTGEYYVAPDGTVTVYTGIGGVLLSGIEISYYYKNPEFDPANKYSVDYRKGILYSHNTLVNAGTITYKAANYKCSYDVARQINSYTYDRGSNSVSVRTEELHKINNLVKLLWLQSDTGESLNDMVDYFSPIISILGFRFT